MGRPLTLMLLQQVYISDGMEALVRSKLGHAWPSICHEAQSTRVSSLPSNINPYGVTTYVAGGGAA